MDNLNKNDIEVPRTPVIRVRTLADEKSMRIIPAPVAFVRALNSVKLNPVEVM